MKLTMRENPVLILVGGVGAVVEALLALLMAFGMEMTPVQTAAIMGFVGAVTTLVLAVLARSRVDAPATVEAKVDAAWGNGYLDGKADAEQRAHPARPPAKKASAKPERRR